VEYESTDGGYIERINFVFFGGVLSAAQLQTIRIDGCEIEEYRLVSHAEAMAKLNAPLARCIALALRALRQGGTVYTEDGTEVRTRRHNRRRLIRAEYPTEHAASEAIHEAAFGANSRRMWSGDYTSQATWRSSHSSPKERAV